MLTQEQKSAVKLWLQEGASLSDVQKRIKEEFSIALTYMDTRFLVLDIGASVKDKEEPKKEPETISAPAKEEAKPGLKLVLDKVVDPRYLASGTVTFSDGVTGRWYVDQMGRLGLTEVSQEGYQPSPEDLQEFQYQLQTQLG